MSSGNFNIIVYKKMIVSFHKEQCFSLMCLILLLINFSCLYRTVRLSSPTLNYFIIAGAILMYASIFFYLLPTEDMTVVKARCVVRKINTVDLEIFMLGNFCMINFHAEKFRRNNPLPCYINSVHAFS